MAHWRLLRRDNDEPVVQSLEIADRAWSRFKGLQLRAGLPEGTGLLLVPCPSVHTFFMRFPIDVVLLDRAGTVVAVRRRVRPWRLVLPVPRSYAALEVSGGSCSLDVGISLRLEASPAGVVPPRSLAFLCPSCTAR